MASKSVRSGYQC